MILNMKPVSLAEVKELVNGLDEKKELKEYLKKYSKEDLKEVSAIVEKVKGLKNLKLKEEHIIKIADFAPKNAEELNRIFADFALDEKETNEILAAVRGN